MGDKKTTTDETKTTTPNVPDWAKWSLFDLNNKTNVIGQQDPTSFVAPASSLQNQAFTGAGNLGGWSGDAAKASGMLTGLGGATTGQIGPAPNVNAGSLLTNLGNYQSPYTNDVVNSTLSNFDKTAGQQQAQLAASGARNGAFGGSRFGIAQGEQDAQSGLNRAQVEAQLRDQAFNTASGLSSQDAARRQQADTTNATNYIDVSKANQDAKMQDLARQLQAAGLLGNLSNTEATNTRADIGTQDQLGQEQRSIDANYRTAPISQAQVVAALLGQGQYPLMTGSSETGHTTQTTSDPMGMWGGILSGLGTGMQGFQAMGGSQGLASLFGGGGGAAGGMSAATMLV